jgi:hypothetical protein
MTWISTQRFYATINNSKDGATNVESLDIKVMSVNKDWARRMVQEDLQAGAFIAKDWIQSWELFSFKKWIA